MEHRGYVAELLPYRRPEGSDPRGELADGVHREGDEDEGEECEVDVYGEQGVEDDHRRQGG